MANLFIDRRDATDWVEEWGHEGNDTILGSDFDDRLKGAQGNDTIRGNDGDDYITDVTHFGMHAPLIGLSFDKTQLDQVLSALRVNGEFVEEQGNPPGTTLYYGGNDTFSGDDGDDVIYGYNGRDLINGGDDDDEIYGGSGNDTVIGGNGRDLMAGDSGADYLMGGEGDDVMVAGSDDDRLEGGAGADILVGGDGLDTVIYENSRAGVLIDLTAGTADGINGSTLSEAHGDTVTEIENVDGSRGDDTLVGSRGANAFYGNFGNDTLDGRAGGDRLDGAVGIDTVSYFASTAGVAVALDDANRNLVSSASGGHAQGDTLVSIENLDGSTFGDTLTGNSFANILTGLNGNDRLFGLGGDDRLFGGAGNETIGGGEDNDLVSGGAGADIIDGGAGIDTVSFAENARGVTVTLANGAAAGQASTFVPLFPFGFLERDTLYNLENVVGSAAGDRLTGNDGRNILQGGLGDDTFLFSSGGDTLDGDGDIDTLDLSGATGAATVDLQLIVTVEGTGGSTTLRDMENVIGSRFGDAITCRVGDNIITGGEGSDRLTGNGGNDTFVFRSLADMGSLTGSIREIVTDFSEGDLLDFRSLDADADTSGLQAYAFIGDAAFSGSGGEMRARLGGGGNMNITFDLDGDRQIDGRIQLTGATSFDATDFLL